MKVPIATMRSRQSFPKPNTITWKMGTIRTQERAKGVSVWFFSCLSYLAMCSITEKMKK